ncbi:MAG TPA: SIMPL domain-containing protein [Anaerolineales bacterium]|nr:SIMPL domain-containing protein [Anaerolineales bacterium]
MRNKILSFVLLAAIAILSVAAYYRFAQAAPAAQIPYTEPVRTLNINGHGEVTLTPDIAYIYVGVHSENENAGDAVADNNDQVQAVMDALKGAGVKANDISTTNFSLWYSQNYDMNGQPDGGKYVVDNTVYITVRDLDTLGDILGTAIEAGANTVNGISFDVSDKEAAIAEAREKAVADARAQAEELAGLAGVELGDIQSISMYGSYPSPIYGGKGGGGYAAADAVYSVPVTPGQYVVSVDVSLVYGLR